MRIVKAIGLMSGTSLDGLDICYVHFVQKGLDWTVGQMVTENVAYSDQWLDTLVSAFGMGNEERAKRDVEYGLFLGEAVNNFVEKHNLKEKVDFVASHGHTIFHEPAKGITVQIGNGQELANCTGLKVVSDFRSLDVSLGGQGAPLVPIGDHLLFNQYAGCLNLGGFANISFVQNQERKAFDIGPCNLPLNRFAHKYAGLTYDKGGAIAQSGQVIPDLHTLLNALPFYEKNPPKSLGVEWLNEQFYPLVDRFFEVSVEDVMRTILEHETDQIAEVINKQQLSTVLVTGGGALNEFFMRRLRAKTTSNLIVPNKALVEFKEALIFAFLGLLRVDGAINTLKSVTGARTDSSGGRIDFPQSSFSRK